MVFKHKNDLKSWFSFWWFKFQKVRRSDYDIKNMIGPLVKQREYNDTFFSWRQNLRNIILFYAFYRFQSYYSRVKFAKKLREKEKTKQIQLANFQKDFSDQQNYLLKNYHDNKQINSEFFKDKYWIVCYSDDLLKFFEIYQQSKILRESYDIHYLFITDSVQFDKNKAILANKKQENTIFAYHDQDQTIGFDKDMIYAIDQNYQGFYSAEISPDFGVQDILKMLKIKLNKYLEKEFLQTLKK